MPSWGEVLELVRSRPDPHDEVRQHYLEELHKYEERDVLLYSSGWTHSGVNSARDSIIDADMQGIMEAFSSLEGDELDMVIHSPGGSPGAAESIIDYIRSKYDDVRIFVPHAAMSAATLMCCSATELVMGRHSFLGPIDPQITLDTPTGNRPVPAAAILNQFKQAQEEIEEDENQLAHWTPILRQYGPGLIQECEQAIELSKELAQDWAADYLLSGTESPQLDALELAERLTDWEEFKTHNRHLHRDKARDLGFPISDLEEDDRLQDLVLSLYHAATLTHDNKNISKIIETHSGSTFIAGAGRSGNANGNSGANIALPTPEPPSGPPQGENSDVGLR
jgi:hypothetical protein